MATGFVFLWAFLDKTFGLHYATPTAKAWINEGSPTKGFLASVDVGPFQSVFHSVAGTWWAGPMRAIAVPPEADVLLIDGAIAHIRPVRPADAAALRDLYDRLSQRTLYL